MIVLALDDEKIALAVCMDAIEEAMPDAEIHGFRIVEDAIEFAKENQVDIAFLDIRMKGYIGTDVARMLKKINPRVNVIFATGYDEYRKDAFELHASGYLTKPITPEAVKEEILNLRFPIGNNNELTSKGTKRIKAHTFGNFDLIVDGKPVEFQRTLAKEVLAYLIDKRGAQVNRQEISLLIFGDEDYSRKTQDYLSKIMKSLENSLAQVKASEIFVKQRNAYSVDIEKFDCDAYDYLNGDPTAMNAFYGEYMAQYLWSEDSIDKFY